MLVWAATLSCRLMKAPIKCTHRMNSNLHFTYVCGHEFHVSVVFRRDRAESTMAGSTIFSQNLEANRPREAIRAQRQHCRTIIGSPPAWLLPAYNSPRRYQRPISTSRGACRQYVTYTNPERQHLLPGCDLVNMLLVRR